MYTISDDIDVYVTFETMNNRGKPLSHLELLKNRLIYISTLFDSGESDKNRLRRDINYCWKQIYHMLGKSKEERLQDDEFLIAHYMLYFTDEIHAMKNDDKYYYYGAFGEWQTNFLLNEFFIPSSVFEGELTMTQCFEYIDSLNKCILHWDFIKNPDSINFSEEIKEYTKKIKYLTMQRNRYYHNGYNIDLNYVNVFILACFRECDSKEKILLKFLKSFEKYFVFN